MSVTLYDQPSLTGKTKKLSADVPDLSNNAFFKMTRSLQVEGQPWVMFNKADYKGNFRIYQQGKHYNLGDFAEEIASARQIKVSLENPEIVLYEDINYCGKDVTIYNSTEDVKAAGLEGKVSAHKVNRGVWILFMDTRFRGQRMFTMEDQTNYCKFGWNDRLCSLEPVTDKHLEKPQ